MKYDMDKRELQRTVQREFQQQERKAQNAKKRERYRYGREATTRDLQLLQRNLEEKLAYKEGKEAGYKVGFITGFTTSILGGLLLWWIQSMFQ